MDLLGMKSCRFSNFQTFGVASLVFLKHGFQCAAVYIYIYTHILSHRWEQTHRDICTRALQYIGQEDDILFKAKNSFYVLYKRV